MNKKSPGQSDEFILFEEFSDLSATVGVEKQ